MRSCVQKRRELGLCNPVLVPHPSGSYASHSHRSILRTMTKVLHGAETTCDSVDLDTDPLLHWKMHLEQSGQRRRRMSCPRTGSGRVCGSREFRFLAPPTVNFGTSEISIRALKVEILSLREICELFNHIHGCHWWKCRLCIERWRLRETTMG